MANKSVLWVDDDSSMLALASIVAQTRGWTFFSAGRPEGAIATYEKEKPSAIVLDVILKTYSTDRRSGIDICNTIREKDKDTIIVFNTGMDSDFLKLETKMARADWTFVKPNADPNDILTKIEEIQTKKESLKPQIMKGQRSADDYLRAIVIFVLAGLSFWCISNRISDARWQGQVEGTLKSDQQHTQQLLKIMKDDIDMSWAYVFLLRDQMKESGLKPPALPKRPNYSEESEK